MTRINKALKVDFPKKSKGEKISSIITLLIAIFGGIPGLFIIKNYLHTPRVIFEFKLEAFPYGVFPPEYGGAKFLMLVGTVTNRGDKPLIPKTFDLKIKIADKWISLEKTVIPPDDAFKQSQQGEQVVIIESAADKDLLKYNRPITREEPAYGNLLFTSDNINIEDLKKSMNDSNSITFELSCTGCYDDKYTVTQTQNLGKIRGMRGLPKHGISYGPR